jgi:hypothetical protein
VDRPTTGSKSPGERRALFETAASKKGARIPKTSPPPSRIWTRDGFSSVAARPRWEHDE